MNIRRLTWPCLSVLSAMLISPALPQQAGRVALLMGNNNYPDASTPLPSTIRDARALAEELRRSEFDVDLKENVGKADMQRAIDAFTVRSATERPRYSTSAVTASKSVDRPTSFQSMPKFGPKPTFAATASASMRYWRTCTAKVQR
jgi:hypothetical protein